MVQGSVPKDVKAPTIARWNNDRNEPVVKLALVSPTRSGRERSILAEDAVERRLRRVAGVARVEVNGLTQREVRIDFDPVRLRAWAVTPAETASALKEADADQPAGLLSEHTQDVLLRVEGRVRDPRRFDNVVVAKCGDPSLTPAHPGQLIEREPEPDSLSRINGQPAITCNVFKQQDANIGGAGEAVKTAIDEVRKTLPPDMELRLVHASSDRVKGSPTRLRNTLVEGALLTVAIVFLFLHSWRSTIITGLTLPIIVTTMAMVFGMLPLAWALNDGGETQAPMARAITGGVIASTLPTLLLPPRMCSDLARLRQPQPAVAEAVAGSAAGPLAMPADRA